MSCNDIDISTVINKIILKRRPSAAKYEHVVEQYQSQKIGVYDPYQVNDYNNKGAGKEIYCLDNYQTFIG